MTPTFYQTTPTTFNLTPSTLAMNVLATTAYAVYLRLPLELQRPCEGGCQCEHCEKDYHATPAWDTLVVPTGGKAFATSYTVHLPDGAVADFVSSMRLKQPGAVTDGSGR